jgi:hypothetical protein
MEAVARDDKLWGRLREQAASPPPGPDELEELVSQSWTAMPRLLEAFGYTPSPPADDLVDDTVAALAAALEAGNRRPELVSERNGSSSPSPCGHATYSRPHRRWPGRACCAGWPARPADGEEADPDRAPGRRGGRHGRRANRGLQCGPGHLGDHREVRRARDQDRHRDGDRLDLPAAQPPPGETALTFGDIIRSHLAGLFDELGQGRLEPARDHVDRVVRLLTERQLTSQDINNKATELRDWLSFDSDGLGPRVLTVTMRRITILAKGLRDAIIERMRLA